MIWKQTALKKLKPLILSEPAGRAVAVRSVIRRYVIAQRADPRMTISRKSAGGGSRTHTGLSPLRILSPMCLPFHHAGSVRGRILHHARRRKREIPGAHLTFVVFVRFCSKSF